jgi:hypothetical protein
MENMMSEAQHERATNDARLAAHPCCDVCDEPACMVGEQGQTDDCHDAELGVRLKDGGKLVPLHLTCVRAWRLARATELADALVVDVAAGLMKFNERGVTVTAEQAEERARNIVAGLVGNFDIRKAA